MCKLGIRSVLTVFTMLAAAGCVREQDLAAWEGKPVYLLDTHPFFSTLPMHRSIAADGTEVRNYANTATVSSCGVNAYSPYGITGSCVERTNGCNNIFYIRNGTVLRYAPTGRCRTAAFLQPQQMY